MKRCKACHDKITVGGNYICVENVAFLPPISLLNIYKLPSV